MYLYTNNEISEKLFKIPFKMALRQNLRVNLTKEVKDLYSENYKTLLMKELEDDSKKWKDIPCSWIGKILLKWP